MTTSTLPRVIGVSGVAFTAFNCVVGVGIFGLPGIVAGVLGPAAVLAYAVCLVLFGLIALCLAEAGSRVSGAGGLYAYASAAFGPVVGGVAGVLMIFASSIGSAAALTRFFMDTLTGVLPFLTDPVWNFVAMVVLYGSIALINIIGTRDGNWLTITIGFLKFVPLALLIIVGAFFVVPGNLTWTELPTAGKIGDATLILFFAFVGIESALSVSGETNNPARTIPRALAMAIVMIALLYIGLQTVTQGVLGTALASSKQPLVDTARRARSRACGSDAARVRGRASQVQHPGDGDRAVRDRGHPGCGVGIVPANRLAGGGGHARPLHDLLPRRAASEGQQDRGR